MDKPGDRPHGPTAQVPVNAQFQAEPDKIVDRQHRQEADAPAISRCWSVLLLPYRANVVTSHLACTDAIKFMIMLLRAITRTMA
jgi:hypothetical protein